MSAPTPVGLVALGVLADMSAWVLAMLQAGYKGSAPSLIDVMALSLVPSLGASTLTTYVGQVRECKSMVGTFFAFWHPISPDFLTDLVLGHLQRGLSPSTMNSYVAAIGTLMCQQS